jgi:translocator protein
MAWQCRTRFRLYNKVGEIVKKTALLEIGKLLLCIVASQMAGIIGGIITATSVMDWYPTLRKPSFTPPDWLFGPTWTVLFVIMGIAAYLVLRSGIQGKLVKISLGIFLVQLVLNLLWSIVFFGLKSPGGAMIEIVFLWLAILITAIYFFKVSMAAGWLMLPYIAWVSFAAILNFQIWRIN